MTRLKAASSIVRVVTMLDLTPNAHPGGGYSLHGSTDAEVKVCADGLRIRAKGKRGEPWRFLPWAEAWISAAVEG